MKIKHETSVSLSFSSAHTLLICSCPGIPGMPPYPPTSLVRTFSPNSSDALESSRHLYTQDFSANAQRMHNPGQTSGLRVLFDLPPRVARVALYTGCSARGFYIQFFIVFLFDAAARGSPFPTSVASIPASPVIVTNPAASPLVIPPRHAGEDSALFFAKSCTGRVSRLLLFSRRFLSQQNAPPLSVLHPSSSFVIPVWHVSLRVRWEGKGDRRAWAVTFPS